jgi:hypothetical protein
MGNSQRGFYLKTLVKGILVMLSVLVAASLALASYGSYLPEPTVNLSAIRTISCDEGYGTGFMIADNVVATANHVAELTNCVDGATDVPLRRYVIDEAHDFALMGGQLPDMPYIKVSCSGYTTGAPYDLFGYSAFRRPFPIFQYMRLEATDRFTDDDFFVGPERTPMPGMRYLSGFSVAGLSGSPITHGGYAVGILNVGFSTNLGYTIMPKAASYQLKDTILCRKP